MPRNILNDTIFVTFYFVSTELQNELTICIIMDIFVFITWPQIILASFVHERFFDAKLVQFQNTTLRHFASR